MFSNTPVGTHRIQQSPNRVHGPPGDQPSHPIPQRIGTVTGARISNRDPNSIPLSQSNDDDHVLGIIADTGALDSSWDQKHSPARGNSMFRQFRNTTELNGRKLNLGPPNTENAYSEYKKFVLLRFDNLTLFRKFSALSFTI